MTGIQTSEESSSINTTNSCSRQLSVGRWKKAFRKLRESSFILDPWHDFSLAGIATTSATRYRYSSIKKKWIQDQVQVKIETKPFDRGAMRECFRLKKLTSTHDWKHASNYVAKKYLDSSAVSRETYFDDVKLQMDAKLWGEAFNRHDPPKKVDIFQMSILEIAETNSLYHIERFMDGEYRKYNSNSGFVDEQLRNTPHAFSHFTFERSGHRLMVVDIQGVGDLYTDPQIHTSDGTGYSDGNLGLRGMALFFNSHRCNPLCKYLGLAPFDLSSKELEEDPQEDAARLHSPMPSEDEALPLDEDEEEEAGVPVCIERSGSMDGIVHMNPAKPSLLAAKCQTPRRRTLSCNTSRDSLLQSGSTGFGSASKILFGPTVARSSQESLNASSSVQSLLALNRANSLLQQQSRDRLYSGDSGCLVKQRSSQTEDSSLEDQPVSVDAWSPCFPSKSNVKEVAFTFDNDVIVPSLRVAGGCHRNRAISESSDLDLDLYDGAASPGVSAWGGHHSSIHHMLLHPPGGVHHHYLMHELQKPASADHPTNLDQEIGQSILGQIHHELARLHEAGRFVKTSSEPELMMGATSGGALAELTTAQVDWSAVLFHEKHAAQLGCLEAMIVLAHYCLGLPSALLSNCPIAPGQSDLALGMDYLWRAAEGGDRRCMILLARYLDNNGNSQDPKWARFITTPTQMIIFPRLAEVLALEESASPCCSSGKSLLMTLNNNNNNNKSSLLGDEACSNSRPWAEACVWYRKAVDCARTGSKQVDHDGLDAEGRYDAADDLLPVHRILARMAELHIMGGHGLVHDPSQAGDLFNEAGEAANGIRQGKLAMCYFELAEEAWALLEEAE